MLTLLEHLSESTVSLLGGLVIGILFGVFAQRSRFCLRSAVVEFWRGSLGKKVAVWLLVFSAALLGTQLLNWTGVIDITQARQLSNAGSLSGAIIGGLMFGAGMILARGCASRLLVLSATGNLRALLSGLIFAVTAQATLYGLLSPIREWLTHLWVISDPQKLDFLAVLGLPQQTGLVIAILFFVGAAGLAFYRRIIPSVVIFALGVGSLVAVAWGFTYMLAENAFGVFAFKSLTFTGPSADALMAVLVPGDAKIDFDLGLVPGVFLGSFVAAIASREWKVVGFISGLCMRRYIFGAILMGFGGMLAGGCAVGAGVSGGAVFALISWLALFGMWIGGGLTDYFIDRENETCVVTGVTTPAQP